MSGLPAGWTRHLGGSNPAPGRRVRVLFRDGGTNEGPSAAFLGWFHEPPHGSPALQQEDIVGYAVIDGGRKPYVKTERWHAAKARRKTVPPSSKADFLKSPERVARDAARVADSLSVPSVGISALADGFEDAAREALLRAQLRDGHARADEAAAKMGYRLDPRIAAARSMTRPLPTAQPGMGEG